jgi:hypothetical protein
MAAARDDEAGITQCSMNGPDLCTRNELVSECSALIVTRKTVQSVVEVKTLEKGTKLDWLSK